MKILAFLLIVIGELLVVYSEMSASRIFELRGAILKSILPLIIRTGIMLIAGAVLLMGFMIGIEHYESIWVVNVMSTTLVLIIEPVIAYKLFKYFPEKNTIIGFFFGVVGLLCVLIIK